MDIIKDTNEENPFYYVDKIVGAKKNPKENVYIVYLAALWKRQIPYKGTIDRHSEWKRTWKNYWTLSFMSAHFNNNLSLCYKCSFCFWDPGFLVKKVFLRIHILLFYLPNVDSVQLKCVWRDTVCVCLCVCTRHGASVLWCFFFSFNVTTASTNRDSHGTHPYINPNLFPSLFSSHNLYAIVFLQWPIVHTVWTNRIYIYNEH